MLWQLLTSEGSELAQEVEVRALEALCNVKEDEAREWFEGWQRERERKKREREQRRQQALARQQLQFQQQQQQQQQQGQQGGMYYYQNERGSQYFPVQR